MQRYPKASLEAQVRGRGAYDGLEGRLDDLGADGGIADVDVRSRLRLPPDDCEGDRPVRGGEHGRSDLADGAIAETDLVSVADGGLEAEPPQVAVGLALVVQPGDRLLADVAALGETHRALVDPGLLGNRGRRHLASEARAA